MCKGRGWIFYEDEQGYEWQKECDCGTLRKIRMDARLRFANLPPLYKDFRLKNISLSVYRNPESKQIMKSSCAAIKYWLEHFDEMYKSGKGLYLASDTKGSGKTMMVACIANEIICEKNKSVKFATSMQIINEIKGTWDKSSNQSESELLGELVTSDILIIDDFGTERTRDWISEVFYSIINGRYVDNKMTIFTSNMSIDNLEYDERITNRIKEKCYIIPFPEESVREEIARQNTEELKSIFK